MALAPTTTVYILTRNRLPLLRQAIASVIAQDAPVQLVVSDNSTDDESWQTVLSEFPGIQLIRRQPSLSAHAHFNAVLSEVKTPYLVMFHDDDVMLPGFVRTLEDQLSKHSDLVAVGCNALKLQGDVVAQTSVMGGLSRPQDIRTPMALLTHYLNKLAIAPAPFPGYMYRVDAIRSLQLISDEGGKYADVSFLCKVVERGALRWIPDTLMLYRYHSNNDSKVPDMRAVHGLIRFVCVRYAVRRLDPQVQLFRFRMWHQWVAQVENRNELVRKFPWRLRIVRRQVRLGILKLALREPRLGLAIISRLLLRVGQKGKRS